MRQDTKLRIVRAAIDLFHRFGVNGTSVDRVLEESGAGKGQFSHYFGTKEGMVGSAIRHLHELVETGQTPTGYEVRTWRDFERWFQQFIDFQESIGCERSCPFGTIGADLARDEHAARADLLRFLDWSRGRLEAFFAAKKAQGELVDDAKPRELADFCIAIMQGGMLLSKMRRDTRMFRNASAQAIRYVRSLRRSATRRGD